MKKDAIAYLLTLVLVLFMVCSRMYAYEAGIMIGNNYMTYFKFIFSVLPGVFMLIGLFNVWVKRETVERYMGNQSGFRGYVWALILSSTAIGGLFAVLPIAFTLFKKGGKLSVIMTYMGAACVCRIPMTLFEISMLGFRFTLIRYAVSLPLIVGTSIVIEKFLFSTEELERLREKIID